MRKIDKLLKEGHEIVLNTDEVDIVVPLMKYIETKGARWGSGAKLVEHYYQMATTPPYSYYTFIKKTVWGEIVCYRTSDRGKVSPEELMRPVGMGLKRGEML